MPVAVEDEVLTGTDGLDELIDGLDTLKSSAGAKENDIQFLADFLQQQNVQSLIGALDVLEDQQLEPVGCDTIEVVRDLVDDLQQQSSNPAAKELNNILCNPHFKALIEAHDDIASKNYEPATDIDPYDVFSPPPPVFNAPSTDAIRMVGIRKSPDEPLGITVKKENGDLVIARIMAGSNIERQGLLHVGDIIKEINGKEVYDPDQMTELLRKAGGSFTLKVLPSYYDNTVQSQVFVKAHFRYDPRKDNLIPCRDAGLPFREGEVLQVVNMEDTNWWQAKRVDSNGASGLIPSQTLEEKRKAFVKPEYDYTQKSLLCGLMTKKKKVPTATLR